MTELNNHEREACEAIEEKKNKLEQLKSVLEMYGHFSGINRKVQLKYQPHGYHRNSSEDGEFKSSNLIEKSHFVPFIRYNR